MQNLTSEEVDTKINQICQGLKEDSREYMTYAEAVYVANTLYRTCGKNLGIDILPALKQIADDSKIHKISKSEIKQIILNQEHSNAYVHEPRIIESQVITQEVPRVLETQNVTSNIIRSEYKVANPNQVIDTQPQVIRSSYVYRNDNGEFRTNPNQVINTQPQVIRSSYSYRNNNEEFRTHPNFTGSRKSITFHSNLNTVETPSTIYYEPKSENNNFAKTTTVRTSQYSKNPSYYGDYERRSYLESYKTSEGEYNIVDENKVKRVQLDGNYYDSNRSGYVRTVINRQDPRIITNQTPSVLVSNNTDINKGSVIVRRVGNVSNGYVYNSFPETRNREYVTRLGECTTKFDNTVSQNNCSKTQTCNDDYNVNRTDC